MISQTNSSAVHTAYQSKTAESKEAKQSASVTKEGDTSKLDQLKESIDSGEYKVNIQAVSEKIADSLL
jgi:anti-sigma28 factor (negative regulator of flagellin synthesis)